jgi:hypothetical protein
MKGTQPESRISNASPHAGVQGTPDLVQAFGLTTRVNSLIPLQNMASVEGLPKATMYADCAQRHNSFHSMRRLGYLLDSGSRATQYIRKYTALRFRSVRPISVPFFVKRTEPNWSAQSTTYISGLVQRLVLGAAAVFILGYFTSLRSALVHYLATFPLFLGSYKPKTRIGRAAC